MGHIARWALALLLGLFLIAFGAMKFGGAHIFQYIAFKSGIDLFYPLVNYVVGAAEIIAGLLIIIPATRHLGSALGLGVLGGAILFHLSPWLGVITPDGFSGTAAAPWDATDFVGGSPTLFILASVMGVLALINVALERDRLTALLPARTGAAPAL